MARQKTGGRTKGTPNKATTLAREAITLFIDGNSARLEDWLLKIEKKHGALAAFNCFVDLAEFAVPKLARTEHTGPGGGAMRIIVDRWGKRDDVPAEQLAAEAISGAGMERTIGRRP